MSARAARSTPGPVRARPGRLPFVVAGEARVGRGSLEVRSPFDGSLVARVGTPSAADVEEALQAASSAAEAVAAVPAWQRSEWLLAAAARIEERKEDIARTIAAEAGKPIREARAEATRAGFVFRWAAEECKRLGGEWMPLDTEPALGRRMAIVARAPIGPVVAISPFNFPLNLVAHKVAPALAAGNPVIVKPATATPLSALALAEAVLADPWPPGALSVLPIAGPASEQLVGDPRVAGISFTGSDAVGWRLRGANPRKKVTLELGGNAAVLVEPDADLPHAAERLTFGSFAYAGQVCISTQRILVHERVMDAFLAEFVPRVESLRLGDPLDETTDVGPMISREQLDRVDAWVREALDGGARALTGGRREDPFYLPTVLADVPEEARCWREEVFGPVVSVAPYDGFDAALERANATRFGLQAAVFTSSLERALEAHRRLHAGGVVVNDAPFFRAVQMPYGGVKDSGIGREGVRFAIEEMTELRTLIAPVPGAFIPAG